MALGKEIGDFSLKITSTTFAADGSTVALTCDGEASGFGTVLGTLHVQGEPGAETGTCSWRGDAFLDDGSQNPAMGEGTWEKIGKHKWRVRAVNRLFDGRTLAADGTIDLASRSYSGKLLEWS